MPPGQRGQDRCKELGVDPEGTAEPGRVGRLDRGPELVLRIVVHFRARLVGQPVVLPLERVGRHPGRPPPAGEHRGPVHRDTHDPGLAERPDLPARLVTAQGAGHRGVPGGVLDRGGQHRMRADLDEVPVPVGGEALHRVGEPDRQAQVVVPVAGPVLTRHRLGAHGRVPRHPAGPDPYVREQFQNPVPEYLDLRGVPGGAGLDPAGPHPAGLVARGERVDRPGRPGQDHRRGPVDRGDLHAGVPEREVRGRDGDREHRSPTRDRHHLDAAQRHDPRRVVQAQRPGHAGRGDLALRVADDRGRGDAVRLPPGGEGDHHGEEHRLDHVEPVQRGRAVLLPENRRHRVVHVPAERGVALAHPTGERR